MDYAGGTDEYERSRPTGIFFFFLKSYFCSLFVLFRTFLFALTVLACSFVFAVHHNTNIHALDGIRNRNPSRKATTDLRLDRSATGIGEFKPLTRQPVTSRCTNCAMPAPR